MKSKQPGDSWASMRPPGSARMKISVSSNTENSLYHGVRLFHIYERSIESFLLPFDSTSIIATLKKDNWKVISINTTAENRAQMFQFPKKALQLEDESKAILRQTPALPESYISIIIQDGYSAKAVEEHAVGIVRAFKKITSARKATFTPLVVMHNSQLGISEEVASTWPVNWALVIRGERPTASNTKEVGIYFYDMAFGEGIKSSITMSDAKNSYAQVAKVMAEALWTESARLGLFLAPK